MLGIDPHPHVSARCKFIIFGLALTQIINGFFECVEVTSTAAILDNPHMGVFVLFEETNFPGFVMVIIRHFQTFPHAPKRFGTSRARVYLYFYIYLLIQIVK